MKTLISKGLQHDQVDVQENAARAVAFAIEQEGNLKDLRRHDGIDILIEMHAALPDTDRAPNDMVRQAASFALSVSAFDSECRTEIRMKEGLRALSNCLASENPRVQVLRSASILPRKSQHILYIEDFSARITGPRGARL